MFHYEDVGNQTARGRSPVVCNPDGTKMATADARKAFSFFELFAADDAGWDTLFAGTPIAGALSTETGKKKGFRAFLANRVEFKIPSMAHARGGVLTAPGKAGDGLNTNDEIDVFTRSATIGNPGAPTSDSVSSCVLLQVMAKSKVCVNWTQDSEDAELKVRHRIAEWRAERAMEQNTSQKRKRPAAADELGTRAARRPLQPANMATSDLPSEMTFPRCGAQGSAKAPAITGVGNAKLPGQPRAGQVTPPNKTRAKARGFRSTEFSDDDDDDPEADRKFLSERRQAAAGGQAAKALAEARASSTLPRADARPMCWCGASCYRRNPDHIRSFRHGGSRDTKGLRGVPWGRHQIF